jgi:hypothetical protein
MPRLSEAVRSHVTKARESAILAVDIYNKPATSFRSGGFIVLMTIAWTSFFHAVFFKQRKKPFYRDPQNQRRYQKVDGDYKAWELNECLKQYYGQNHSPERRNAEFIIGLRNKIEHRSMPELDIRIVGECQAFLFNFEDLLFKEFGTKYGLAENLALPLQFSHLRSEQHAAALKALLRPLSSDVSAYIDTFRSSLSVDVRHDPRYSFKVFLIPKLANNPGQADIAVEFVKYDTAKPEEMANYEKLVALIRPSVVQVTNAGQLTAGGICKIVEPVVKELFGTARTFSASYHHVRACYHYKIRPRKGEGDPRKTDTRYCQYDDAHKDYVYTMAWAEFLLAEIKRPDQLEKIFA